MTLTIASSVKLYSRRPTADSCTKHRAECIAVLFVTMRFRQTSGDG